MSSGQDQNADKLLNKLLDSKPFQILTVIALILTFAGFALIFPRVQNKVFGESLATTVEVLNEIPVFSVNQQLPSLSVTFNQEDLTANRKQIVAARVRIRNHGTRGITPVDVSNVDPMGFHVDGGRILKISNISATSTHLLKFALPKITPNNSIVISNNVIIDPDDSLTLDLIIIKPVGSVITFSPIGKIEGLRTIGLSDYRFAGASPSYLNQAFAGGLWVQLGRVGAYFIAGLLILVATIGIIIQISAIQNRRIKEQQRRVAEEIRLANNNATGTDAIFNAALLSYLGHERFIEFSEFAKLVNEETFFVRRPQFDFSGDHSIGLPLTIRSVLNALWNNEFLTPADIARIASSVGLAENESFLPTDEWKQSIAKLVSDMKNDPSIRAVVARCGQRDLDTFDHSLKIWRKRKKRELKASAGDEGDSISVRQSLPNG